MVGWVFCMSFSRNCTNEFWDPQYHSPASGDNHDCLVGDSRFIPLIVIIHFHYTWLDDLPMNCIMLPSPWLLDTNSTPLCFGQETALGQWFGKLLGKNYMPENILEEGTFSMTIRTNALGFQHLSSQGTSRCPLSLSLSDRSIVTNRMSYLYSLKSSAYFSLYSMRGALMVKEGQEWAVNQA